MEPYNKLTVINLRGTSGSGKTTIVRNILSHGEWKPIRDNSDKVLAYLNPQLKWAVIGSYENTCGGCDTIRTQQGVEDRIDVLLNAGYNIIFEGLLISTISSRWIRFSQRISDRANTLFYYLDTPLEECLRRVKLRRIEAGNTKEFNPKNTTDRVKAIETTYCKLSQAGCYCLKADQQEIMRSLHTWFGLGG